MRRLETECAEVRDQLDSLRARMRRLEDRERPSVPRPGEMALNLTTRATALKLSRSGRNVRQIAQTLGVPAGEIELLLKVERMQCPPRAPEREGLAGMAEGNCSAGARRVGAKENPLLEPVN